ncbi:MAG TPA: hypothetical protein VF178_15275 [Gemmatimonadaceae bacterium]
MTTIYRTAPAHQNPVQQGNNSGRYYALIRERKYLVLSLATSEKTPSVVVAEIVCDTKFPTVREKIARSRGNDPVVREALRKNLTSFRVAHALACTATHTDFLDVLRRMSRTHPGKALQEMAAHGKTAGLDAAVYQEEYLRVFRICAKKKPARALSMLLDLRWNVPHADHGAEFRNAVYWLARNPKLPFDVVFTYGGEWLATLTREHWGPLFERTNEPLLARWLLGIPSALQNRDARALIRRTATPYDLEPLLRESLPGEERELFLAVRDKWAWMAVGLLESDDSPYLAALVEADLVPLLQHLDRAVHMKAIAAIGRLHGGSAQEPAANPTRGEVGGDNRRHTAGFRRASIRT